MSALVTVLLVLGLLLLERRRDHVTDDGVIVLRLLLLQLLVQSEGEDRELEMLVWIDRDEPRAATGDRWTTAARVLIGGRQRTRQRYVAVLVVDERRVIVR